jgi:uncharacterized phiE125 gp8 family phage protein
VERLTVLVPPAVEPVALADAVLQCRDIVAADDTLVTRLISACRAFCEKELRQSFITQTLMLHLDGFPSSGGYYNRQIRQQGPTIPSWLPTSTVPIPLYRPPVQSVTSVKYYDQTGTLQTIDPATYTFEVGTPSRLAPKFGQTWPVVRPRPGAIEITYVAGYGDTAAAIPAGDLAVIQTAILLGLAGMYENRGDDSGGMNEDAMRSILSTLDHGSYG